MQGFLSYAHANYADMQTFRTQLRIIGHAYGIDFWCDDRLSAGYLWHDSIMKEIDAAEVFVLLVSSDFLASDYIITKEIPAILARRATNPDVLIVPVILEQCLWHLRIKATQAVPTTDGKLEPVKDWAPQRNGFVRAGEQIAATVQKHFGLAPADPVL